VIARNGIVGELRHGRRARRVTLAQAPVVGPSSFGVAGRFCIATNHRGCGIVATLSPDCGGREARQWI